jgi:hypothetical protein
MKDLMEYEFSSWVVLGFRNCRFLPTQLKNLLKVEDSPSSCETLKLLPQKQSRGRKDRDEQSHTEKRSQISSRLDRPWRRFCLVAAKRKQCLLTHPDLLLVS